MLQNHVCTGVYMYVCERKINLRAPKLLSYREQSIWKLLMANCLPYYSVVPLLTEINVYLIGFFGKSNQKLERMQLLFSYLPMT